MTGLKAVFVVTRFKEDVSWIKNYTDNYVIYNKGESLGEGYNEVLLSNDGHNQKDIFEFIYRNYENLPDLIAFLQGNPFAHCSRKDFNLLIKSEKFTSLESYKNNVVSGRVNSEGFYIEHNNRIHYKNSDGLYTEKNNNFYIEWHQSLKRSRSPCIFKSFDDFMQSIFENYEHLEWITFCPGSQYIIERERALFYPKSFWKKLMSFLNNGFEMTEAHVIERGVGLIFQNKYKHKRMKGKE